MKTDNTDNNAAAPDTPPKKMTIGGWIFSAILSILAVGFFLVLPMGALLDYLREQRIDYVEPAGELVNVLPVGSWNPDAMIQTTTGFYTVGGSVALASGTRFRLETRDNGAQFLCNVNGKYCGRIIGCGLEQPPKASPVKAGGGK